MSQSVDLILICRKSRMESLITYFNLDTEKLSKDLELYVNGEQLEGYTSFCSIAVCKVRAKLAKGMGISDHDLTCFMSKRDSVYLVDLSMSHPLLMVMRDQ